MTEEAAYGSYYAGTFSKNIDEKRRLTLPAKWRFKGDNSDNSYLAIPTTYGSIAVYPPQMREELRQKIAKISMANPQKRMAVQMFMGDSCTFGCDKQGRIMLDEALLSRAGISKEAEMVGMGATFEIWDPKTRKAWLKGSKPGDYVALMEELGL